MFIVLFKVLVKLFPIKKNGQDSDLTKYRFPPLLYFSIHASFHLFIQKHNY